jgi:uncharacterized protein affecting Mg2+/Co2+ transport
MLTPTFNCRKDSAAGRGAGGLKPQLIPGSAFRYAWPCGAGSRARDRHKTAHCPARLPRL